jgi:ATP-dependent DNA ligase
MVLLRQRVAGRGIGAVEPCLSSPANRPPPGPGWIHDIKHDGFRIVARRDGASVRLLTRAGNDFSRRFPFIAVAVAALPAESCVIDGEAIVTNEHGLAVFDLIRGHGAKAEAVHCAFDLLELDGEDLCREPIETRKATLASLPVVRIPASCSTSISRAMVKSSTGTPANLAAKASCQSGSGRPTAPAARRIG